MASPDTAWLVLPALSYLLGSIPSALLVCHFMGLDDPRERGSGNPGASNVLRTGGRGAALLTLSGDLGKGFAAIWLAQTFSNEILTIVFCSIAAMLGHIRPLFAGFTGGKGVATAVGISLALSPPLGLIQLLLWSLLFYLKRIASVASIGSALASPLLAWLISPALLLPVSIISLIVISTHRSNLYRLLEGSERRF